MRLRGSDATTCPQVRQTVKRKRWKRKKNKQKTSPGFAPVQSQSSPKPGRITTHVHIEKSPPSGPYPSRTYTTLRRCGSHHRLVPRSSDPANATTRHHQARLNELCDPTACIISARNEKNPAADDRADHPRRGRGSRKGRVKAEDAC